MLSRTDGTRKIHYFCRLWFEREWFDFQQARASFLLQHVQTHSGWLLFCCPVSGNLSFPVVPRLRKFVTVCDVYTISHVELNGCAAPDTKTFCLIAAQVFYKSAEERQLRPFIFKPVSTTHDDPLSFEIMRTFVSDTALLNR